MLGHASESTTLRFYVRSESMDAELFGQMEEPGGVGRLPWDRGNPLSPGGGSDPDG